MAKKRKPTKKAGAKNLGLTNPPLNPRDMQKMMAQAMAELMGEQPSPEEMEAEELIERACQARSPDQAEKFARQALRLDPGQLEAYEILSELASTPEAAIAQLELGLRAGETALGKKMFREGAGHFWGIHETRPYMKLRHALASRLWHSGRRDEGIIHLQEMLGLNPNDNQGLRQILAGWYLEQRRFDEAEALLQDYPERSCWWAYTRALLTFAREGASDAAIRELRQAERANKFLPRYLTGLEVFPPDHPEYYSPGKESEGIIFARYYLPAWRSTPGALGWLRTTLRLGEMSEKGTVSPEHFETEIGALPQNFDEAWEIDVRQLDEEMEVDGEYCRPWVFLALTTGTKDLIQIGCSCAYYNEEDVLDLAIESMANPVTGEPRRPGKLLVNSSPLSKALYKKLKEWKVRCEYQPELEAVEDLLLNRPDFIRHFARGFQKSAADLDLADLRELPQEYDEIWQIDSRPLPMWVGSGDAAATILVLLVVDARDNLVPSMEVQSSATEIPRPEQSLLKGISFPLVGEPRRPGLVQVRTEQVAEALRETLETLDIRLEVTKDLDAWDEAFASLSQSLGGGGQERPALVMVPGGTAPQIAGVFAAMSDFYRAAPWRKVIGDSLIRIAAPSLATAPWFGCIMGQMGETFGVALYEDEDFVREMLRNKSPDHAENMRGCSSLVLMYGERHEAAPQDATAIAERGLALAAPEAYPTLLRMKPGIAIQKPLLWEVKFMEAALRALPQYLQLRTREAQTLTVSAFGEPAVVTLEFVS